MTAYHRLRCELATALLVPQLTEALPKGEFSRAGRCEGEGLLTQRLR